MIHDDVCITVTTVRSKRRHRGHLDDESAVTQTGSGRWLKRPHSRLQKSLSFSSAPLFDDFCSLDLQFHFLADWGLIGSAKRRRRGCNNDRYPNPARGAVAPSLLHNRRGRWRVGIPVFSRLHTLHLTTQHSRVDRGTQPTCRRCRGDCEREPATQEGSGLQICGGPGNV